MNMNKLIEWLTDHLDPQKYLILSNTLKTTFLYFNEEKHCTLIVVFNSDKIEHVRYSFYVIEQYQYLFYEFEDITTDVFLSWLQNEFKNEKIFF